ncbi:probable amino acid transporters [Cephalotrichum gorgonifer]|uniref:Probable amino acid transporters n=1 Tax=Cephalotrichum gorgonifer TaxID=2041049 RepID=A0AAE8MWF1_9PEZI|nr:probable amino acid transporters [Cephalotrichum gorgonifer]
MASKEYSAWNGSADEKGQSSTGPESESGIMQLTESAGTRRNIQSRHAQMIAIGGSIGTALFIGTGQVLATGGPAFLFLSYVIMAFFVYCMVTAIIEVGTHLPISGSSTTYYCTRYVSRSLGFALGWLYVYAFGVIVAYEITAATVIINYWPNNVHPAVWITVVLVVIVGLNLSPVAVYAETEFWFASLKIILIIGLLILSVILMAGGGPSGEVLGFKYWNDPGATKEYLIGGPAGTFTAFLYCLVYALFSFNFSPELIIFTGGEMRHPRKNLAIASRRFFYRLLIFYVLGSLAIGATCNSTAEGLTSAAGNADASPWVIAIRDAGIRSLPSVVNAGILLSAWSAGNSYLYMSSRSLYSLAVSGNAPKIFTRCNRYGLPIYAVLGTSLFSFLAYMSLSSSAVVVFNWFVNMTNSGGLTSWIVCSIIFLRFRAACAAQGIRAPYRSVLQPYGAWIALIAFVILLLLNGFTVFYPGQWTASKFVTAYVAAPLFITIYLGHKFTVGRNDPWFLDAKDMDITTGLREVEADAEIWEREDQVEKEKRSRGKQSWRIVSAIWG